MESVPLHIHVLVDADPDSELWTYLHDVFASTQPRSAIQQVSHFASLSAGLSLPRRALLVHASKNQKGPFGAPFHAFLAFLSVLNFRGSVTSVPSPYGVGMYVHFASPFLPLPAPYLPLPCLAFPLQLPSPFLPVNKLLLPCQVKGAISKRVYVCFSPHLFARFTCCFCCARLTSIGLTGHLGSRTIQLPVLECPSACAADLCTFPVVIRSQSSAG